MVEIEIDEQQREHLERLRTELADEHVGEYGHVRYRDVVQYLIDQTDSIGDETDATSQRDPATRPDEGDPADTDEGDLADTDESDADATEQGGDATTSESADDGGGTESSGEADDGGSASRLQRMMGLLDDHDDVWERTNTEEGRYAVTLPDGSTEHVRTKDDVRALLFQHYD